MKFEELQSKLKELDVIIPAGTIRRWAAEGIIKPPTRRSKSKGEGRGSVSDWSQQTLEEIAAVWAVKRYGTASRDVAGVVRTAKMWAEIFYDDPISWKQRRSLLYNELYAEGGFVESHLPKEVRDLGFKGLSKTAFWIDEWDFTEWVAAIEKVRAGCSVSKHVYVTFVFFAYGTIKDKTFRYNFVGVYVKETEKTETGQKGTDIRVYTTRAERFLREVNGRK